MIGMKELGLVNTGRKLVSRFKKNFGLFTEKEFCIRVGLYDDKGRLAKVLEYFVTADNLMDYIENDMDFGNYKIQKIEVFIPTKEDKKK